MNSVVKIIDLFKTSIGEVAILAFFENKKPHIGMILKNEENLKWTVKGTGRNRKLDLVDKYVEYNAESIWDCVIEPINHFVSPKLNANLEIV